MMKSAGESAIGLFWPTAIILIATFFITQHDCSTIPLQSTVSHSTNSVSALHLPATVGIRTRFAFLGFAALGAVLLLLPARRPLQNAGTLSILMAAGFLLWASSLPWYESPVTAANRTLPWACFIFGLLGLARQFTVREIAKLTVVVTGAFLAIGVGTEILLGKFNPQRIGYEFSGMLTPDVQGTYCSLLVLSALAVLGHTKRNLPLHLGLIAIGVLFLLLTKSPIACWGFAVVVLLNSFLRPVHNSRDLNWLWFPALVVAMVALFVFGAESQNGFSKILQEVGLSGLLLWFMIAAFGAWQAWVQFRKSGDQGYRFVIAQVVFGLVNCLANTQYLQPSLCVALCLAGLASLELTASETRFEVPATPFEFAAAR